MSILGPFLDVQWTPEVVENGRPQDVLWTSVGPYSAVPMFDVGRPLDVLWTSMCYLGWDASTASTQNNEEIILFKKIYFYSKSTILYRPHYLYFLQNSISFRGWRLSYVIPPSTERFAIFFFQDTNELFSLHYVLLVKNSQQVRKKLLYLLYNKYIRYL